MSLDLATGGILVAAAVGALSGLLVAPVGPLIAHFLDRRRLARRQREVIISKLEGLRTALPKVALQIAKHEVNSGALHWMLLNAKRDENERPVFTANLYEQMRSSASTVNNLEAELLALNQELAEVLADARLYFRHTPPVLAVSRWFEKPHEIPRSELVADAGKFGIVEEWRIDRFYLAYAIARATYEKPISSLVDELRSQNGRRGRTELSSEIEFEKLFEEARAELEEERLQWRRRARSEDAKARTRMPPDSAERPQDNVAGA